jgi:orotidine-5'-phosphate decarboxylase
MLECALRILCHYLAWSAAFYAQTSCPESGLYILKMFHVKHSDFAIAVHERGQIGTLDRGGFSPRRAGAKLAFMPLSLPHESVLVALDMPERDKALALAKQLETHVGGFKIGLDMFCSCGPQIVEDVGPSRVFLDLKFHDIPNTVAAVSRVAARLGTLLFNVHCLGGFEMMRVAVEAAKEENSAAKVIGVTVLTSHDSASLQNLGIHESPRDAVVRLAELAQRAGLDGVVCSPREILPVRAHCGDQFLLVTPGIRPPNAAIGDQKRVLTPREALQAGANYLVVGRPITGAADPVAAAQKLFEEK